MTAAELAAELERRMIAAFGPDFREKVIVGPVSSFPLRDVFEECGLRDPRAPDPSAARGLWQVLPPRQR